MDGPVQRAGENGNDDAHALGVSPDGSRVYVTGSSGGVSSLNDYATVAYDAATGTELWTARYDGPANAYDYAHALGVSPDGSMVYVTGGSYSVASSSDYATVAYEAATGAEVWTARYEGPGNGNDDASALGVSPDGSRVYVTGDSWGASSFYDYATVAHDAGTGAQVWTARYNGPANGYEVTSALGVSPDGSRVYVTGWNGGASSSYDYATVAYVAASGAVAWGHREAGRGGDVAYALGVSPVGSRVFVTGWHTVSPDGRTDYGTIAYAG